jgi:hypothetical protein
VLAGGLPEPQRCRVRCQMCPMPAGPQGPIGCSAGCLCLHSRGDSGRCQPPPRPEGSISPGTPPCRIADLARGLVVNEEGRARRRGVGGGASAQLPPELHPAGMTPAPWTTAMHARSKPWRIAKAVDELDRRPGASANVVHGNRCAAAEMTAAQSQDEVVTTITRVSAAISGVVTTTEPLPFHDSAKKFPL